jgi:sugar phosphate permease
VFGRIASVFVEAPEAARLEDPVRVGSLYARLRNEALVGSMVAYGLFYFLRLNLSVAMKPLQEEFHYTNAELGAIAAQLSFTYGVSKGLSGLLADRASPRTFLVAGLLLSVVANVFFGFAASLGVFGVLWALNGAFQSTGAVASAKIMATWFSASERGTKTGIWNCSHQAGGAIAVILAGFFAAHFGWRGCFVGPAIVVAVLALLIARFLHDRPEAYGLPPVELHRADPSPAEDAARDVPFSRLLLHQVLLNRRVWLVALGSCCIYIVRYGALTWSIKYLENIRHLPDEEASTTASLLEWAGIPGALLSGWLSDRVFRARRAPVVCASFVLLAGSVWVLTRVPGSSPALDACVLALIGFFTYGPQLLLAGVGPVDMSSKRVAGAAVGFVGFVSYMGASVTNLVMGRLVDTLGWGSAFDFLAIAALVGALLCIPLWHKSAAGGFK